MQLLHIGIGNRTLIHYNRKYGTLFYDIAVWHYKEIAQPQRFTLCFVTTILRISTSPFYIGITVTLIIHHIPKCIFRSICIGACKSNTIQSSQSILKDKERIIFRSINQNITLYIRQSHTTSILYINIIVAIFIRIEQTPYMSKLSIERYTFPSSYSTNRYNGCASILQIKFNFQ